MNKIEEKIEEIEGKGEKMDRKHIESLTRGSKWIDVGNWTFRADKISGFSNQVEGPDEDEEWVEGDRWKFFVIADGQFLQFVYDNFDEAVKEFRHLINQLKIV